MKKITLFLLGNIILFSNLNTIVYAKEIKETNTSINENDKFNKITNLFEKATDANKFMGSLTIRKDNKILYSKAFGNAYISEKNTKKATTNTKYRIGSISKTFTSVLILQLIEEKKLTLDTKLSVFFPEIKNAEKITIDMLLTHKSGIHSFTSSDKYLTYYTKDNTKEDILNFIKEGGSNFEPNSKFEYSNSNFVLLSFIIEKITKKEYKEVLKEKIIDKLGLKNTYYGSKTDINFEESYSYHLKNKEFIQDTETNMSVPYGAGGIISNPEDLTYFITSLFEGKLVNKNTLDELKKIDGEYGKGIFMIPFYNKMALGHNGSIDGFLSILGYFRDDKVAIAINSNYINYSMNNLILGALSYYYDKDFPLPDFKEKPEIEVDETTLKSYEGTYSSKDFPLKITIKIKNKKLFAQATGQSDFPITATSKNEFVFKDADIFMKFEGNKMFFKQGENELIFDREL
ncbi:MAG: serine hydrolase domain-containing protein [Candidatus Sericytochromatia bacterium]